METKVRKGSIARQNKGRAPRPGTRRRSAPCVAIGAIIAISFALATLSASCARRAANETSAKESTAKESSASESPSVSQKASLDEKLSILSGALAWTRKDWAAATAFFLEAERVAGERSHEAIRQYAIYGLASTYLAEDEFDSALARLSALDARLSSEIGSGIWYQAGIVAFRKGEYAASASMFRKSLECDPSRADAKINLELSARCLSESDANRNASDSSFSGDVSPDGASDAIFNLVRKKERDRWKNQEEKSARADVADY